MIRINLEDAIAMSDLAGSKLAAIVVCNMAKPINKQIMTEDGKFSGIWNDIPNADVLICLCHVGNGDRTVRAGKIIQRYTEKMGKVKFQVDRFRTIAITSRSGIAKWCGKQVQPCTVSIALGPQAKGFDANLVESLSQSIEDLRKRIANAKHVPRLIDNPISGSRYARNPDVVALALLKAQGKCCHCERYMPFNHVTSGFPFLEVHHRTPIASGGKDNEDNTEALCPNCHRIAHNNLRCENNASEQELLVN